MYKRQIELVERVSRPGDPGRDLFERLDGFLEALDRSAGRPADLLARFDLGLLAELGLAPALGDCARCGRRAPQPGKGPQQSAFSAAAGGRLCPTCADSIRREGGTVGQLPAAVLERAASLAGSRAGQVAPAPQQEQALARFLERFLVHHLESGLPARQGHPSAQPAQPPKPSPTGARIAGRQG